ncbi:hypothetical protein LIER_25395 [Lithospermum erythrorhizon]|uniref:Uncharacterized protein n=1 Tax=Lithospermum erythrorhizon TaxID=34254 RepID=A0AAV3RAF9_LITER
MRSVESGSSIPKKKFVGTYARHGQEFKLRKATRYIESSSGSENGNVLSESESDFGIRSIANSSDDEVYDLQDRKNIRYVPFNEKSMKDIKFFPGLVLQVLASMNDMSLWNREVGIPLHPPSREVGSIKKTTKKKEIATKDVDTTVAAKPKTK